MAIKALIVDDELLNRKTLDNMIRQFCPDIKVVKSVDNVEDALNSIITDKPDVVFLDIEMNSETGFDLLERAKDHRFSVIFTTAHEQYAIRAFRENAIDYLLKPISHQELAEAVEKVKKQINSNQISLAEELLRKLSETKNEKQQISVSTNNSLLFIKTANIIWLEADGAYTRFHLINQEGIVSSKNISYYEGILDDSIFFRVHHSAIINLNEITKYVRGAGGYVIMSDRKTVNISRQRKEAFLLKTGAM
jgi:two-component system, LytTR family, response regulator